MKAYIRGGIIICAICAFYLFLCGPFVYFNELGKYRTTERPFVYLIYPGGYFAQTAPGKPVLAWLELWRSKAKGKRQIGYRKAQREAVEEIMRAGINLDEQSLSSPEVSNPQAPNERNE